MVRCSFGGKRLLGAGSLVRSTSRCRLSDVEGITLYQSRRSADDMDVLGWVSLIHLRKLGLDGNVSIPSITMRYAKPPFRAHIARPHRQASGSVIYALFLTETKLDRRVLEETRGDVLKSSREPNQTSWELCDMGSLPPPPASQKPGPNPSPSSQYPGQSTLAMEVDCGPDLGSESFLSHLSCQESVGCGCALCVGSGTEVGFSPIMTAFLLSSLTFSPCVMQEKYEM